MHNPRALQIAAATLLAMLQEAQMGDDAYIVPCRLASIICRLLSDVPGLTT